MGAANVDLDMNNRNLKLGYMSAIFVILLEGASPAFVQVLQGCVPHHQMNLLRHATSALIALPVALASGASFTFSNPRSEIPILLLTGVTKMAICYLYYFASENLPVGTLQGLESSTMIVAAAVYSLVKSWRTGVKLMAPGGLCIIGVLLATQPHVLGFEQEARNTTLPITFECCHLEDTPCNNTSTHLITSSASFMENKVTVERVSILFTIISGVLMVLWNILTYGPLKGVDLQVQCFLSSAEVVLLSLPLMLIFETPMLPTSGNCGLILGGHLFCFSVGCIFWYYAMGNVPPLAMSVISAASIVLLGALQYTVLQQFQPGHENWMEILGFACVFVALIAAPIITHFQPSQENKE